MNSAIIVIIFVVALILALGFLLLVMTLIPAITQLRFLLKDLEKTSVEVRELVGNLKIITIKVDEDIDKVDAVLDSTKETVETVKETIKFVDANILRRSASLFAFIPAIKFGWNLIKKFRRR